MPTRLAILLMMLPALLAACGPDYAAIDNRLRDQLQQKDQQLASLHDQLNNRNATITDLQSRLSSGLPPLQTLPPDRLAQLFTAAHLDILNPTDSTDALPGQFAFRIFLRTKTADGTIIPAPGTLTLEAFQLPPAPAAPTRLGTWTFTPEQMKANWYTILGSNYFAFNCPCPAPTQNQITFKARLQDALTGNTLEATLTKTVTLPPPKP